MKRLIHSLVLIFCIHTGCFGNPVRESAKDHIWTYDYTGQIETTTTACNESLARWTISGDLSLYYHEDYMVAKLDNVKTSLFNGPRSKLEHVQEKEIPEESKALLQPFVIKKAADKTLSILLKPNEPLWSINMKKGIANFIHVDIDIFAKEKDAAKLNDKIEKPFEEDTIYGKCSGEYTMEKFESTTTYNKKSSYWNCTNRAMYQETNPLHPLGRSIEMFQFIDFDSENQLTFKETREALWKGSSKTKMTYKIMPSAPYSLSTTQKQTFTLRESEATENQFDISKLTDERNLIYEFGGEPTSGRHVYETDQSVLTKQYLENYEIYDKHFEHPTLENYDVRKTDPIEKMFLILMNMDNQGLTNIEEITKNTNDNDFISFHYTLLPYIGTNVTVKFLSKLLQTVPNSGNSAQLLRCFATIPQNIRHPTDDILVELEPFMDLKNMKQPTVKSAAVLSFASAVGRGCRKERISKKYIEKYVGIYNNKYLGGESSEERMTHLLGLINMAECLDAEFMNTIITNTTEASAFRALAITGFKPYLRVLPNPAFDVYWPIIQNKSEPFDVRVAALDVVLISYPSRNQFDLIVDTYSKHFNDPDDKQLANYLLTSLHSLQNSNWYINNYIGAKATAFVKNNSIPFYPKTWATGNYRLSFTDNEQDMGAYFDTRLITDPKTNVVNGIQLTFNHFISSFDFGTYSLYLKIDGLLDWILTSQYIERFQGASISELLKALKEYEFELKGLSENYRCDIILFVDNVAVYAKIIENGDHNDFKSIVKELEDFFVATPKSISYPVIDYTHMPSELGTPIQISTYVQDISKATFDNNNFKYRSTWNFQTWMEAYNPLADANIASYKYCVDEKNLDYKLNKANKGPTFTFSWENKDDSYTQFWDNMMGTAVEEKDVLKQYCQECEPFNELSTDVYSGYTNNMEPFGLLVDVTRYSHKKNQYPTLAEFYHDKIHQPNVDAFPFAAPILLFVHKEAYTFWLKSDLQRGSYRSYPVTGPNTTVQTTFSLKGDYKITQRYSFNNEFDILALLNTTNTEDNKTVNYVDFAYGYEWMPNFNDEEKNTNLTTHEILRFKFISDYDRSFKICANRNSFFPIIRSDRLSLEPFEAASGKTVLIRAKNIEDDEYCVPKIVHTFSEVYSTSDKEKILEDENMRKDYDKCVSDSKDLKFTAPTAECNRISSRLTEYDDYQVYQTSVTYSEDGQNTTTDIKQPIFESSRDGKDKLKFAISKFLSVLDDSEDAYFNYTIYHPRKAVDPNRMVYSDLDKESTSTCTISPSEVEQFSGKYIPNAKNKWLAFAECYNASSRGLVGHTIDDKHVGFTFYSDEHVVTATVKDGKTEITIDGIFTVESSDPSEEFRVRRLAENVVFIRDKLVDIYYNTEYISVTSSSMYGNLLCGICT